METSKLVNPPQKSEKMQNLDLILDPKIGTFEKPNFFNSKPYHSIKSTLLRLKSWLGLIITVKKFLVRQSHEAWSIPEVKISDFDQIFLKLHSSETIRICDFIHHSNDRYLSNKQAWCSEKSYRYPQEEL